MVFAIGITLFIIFLFLSSIHVYWAFGGQWGNDVALPRKQTGERAFSPGLIACFVVATTLLGAGTFILHQSHILSLSLPQWLTRYGLYFLGTVFLIRAFGDFRYVGFFKSIRESEFARMDTRYYSPLCLLMAILILWLEYLV